MTSLNDKDKLKSTVQPQETRQTYTPSQYTESDSVKQARANLQGLSKPSAYKSTYQASLDDAMSKILNREKFSYNLNGDALFDQYKNQYIKQGKAAMEDTIAKASSMTGGYGNSYAATAGNQAYQSYLGKLNDVIPELYQMALDRYDSDGDRLIQNYSMLADREDTEYGRWRDTMDDYINERGYLTDMYNSERSFDYGKWSDSEDRAHTQWREGVEDAKDAEQFAYQKERDAVSDTRYDTEWQYQKERDAIDDARYEDETAYNREQDAKTWKWNEEERAYEREQDTYERALAMMTGGDPESSVDTEFGSYTAGEFRDKMRELAGDYSYDGDIIDPTAITRAVGLVHEAGDSEAAMEEFRMYFGDEAYHMYFGGEGTSLDGYFESEREPAHIANVLKAKSAGLYDRDYNSIVEAGGKITRDEWGLAKVGGVQHPIFTDYDSYDAFMEDYNEYLRDLENEKGGSK